MLAVKNKKDCVLAAIMVALGFGVIAVAWPYQFGTPMQMGPGFFPILLGGLLAVLGVFIFLQSLAGEPELADRLELRPILFIGGSVVAFALLLEAAGLLAAVFASVLISSRSQTASQSLSWPALILLAAFFAGGSALVFVYMLGQPIPVVRGWMLG